jgi:Chaperone of endosialidase
MGYAALYNNTTGTRNTADGQSALVSNTTGSDNTATGRYALASNTAGNNNTAAGSNALVNNTGDSNTAIGSSALAANATGSTDTAVGANALASNTNSGGLAANTATGANALASNTSGGDNVGVGLLALFNNTTGSGTAIGVGAGAQITGDNNIDIGSTVAGVAGESNTTRIGNSNVTDTYITGIFGAPGFGGNPVYSDADGKLYTVASSKRFKEDIRPMDKSSEALLALKPVTFRYKKDIDPTGTTQFGLVAEQVEKVNRDLVVRDKAGKTYSVRYDQVNAMLLNEFLKEHRRVQELETTVAQQLEGNGSSDGATQRTSDPNPESERRT